MEADRCVVSMSKESLFELSSKRRTALRLIEAALRRVADGLFGVLCRLRGDDIQSRRLQAVPVDAILPCVVRRRSKPKSAANPGGQEIPERT